MRPGQLFSLLAGLFLGGCVGVPDGIEPVSGFELNRYLGTWHEIARLDHPFERGLSRVTASYRMREDGGVAVVNRGYKNETSEWKEATGKAYFVEGADIGRLKVSFFGPFYGGYNIIALDQENYQWVMICGPNRDYLWILSRQPQLAEQLLERLIVKADSLGFDTDKLLLVEHN